MIAFILSFLQIIGLVSGVICIVVITKDDEEEIPVTRVSGLVPKAELFIDSWPCMYVCQNEGTFSQMFNLDWFSNA